jgi:NIMA (never in mitosis gene a)-related kinase
MDYYDENNNIKNKIIQNFFNSRNVWRFFVEIVFALKSLNEHNILIDNFTPQNIFIDKNNTYKIGGFGKILDITKDDEINDNNWKYQSPEILKGEKSDDSSVIWSLGCILYELAFKKTAFDSKENILDIQYKLPEDTENDLNIILKNLLCKKIMRKTIKDLIFDPVFKKKLIEVNLFYENITFDMKSKS